MTDQSIVIIVVLSPGVVILFGGMMKQASRGQDGGQGEQTDSEPVQQFGYC